QLRYNRTMRQVRFPLKLKLLTLMLVLIASSLIIFVGIALKTFREDKSAYIFESMLNKASSEQIILSQKLGKGSFSVKDSHLSFNAIKPEEILDGYIADETAYNRKIAVPVQNNFFDFSSGKLAPISGPEKEILDSIATLSISE